MAMSLINNVSSMTSQHALNRSNTAMARSLERLSTGLKINRGADGPATLVISELQRGQIAGLKQAITNTSRASNVVQIAEGALNEVSKMLLKMRSLALDSANLGVHDDAGDSLNANQAEINRLVQAIDDIATRTKYGDKVLLDGSFDTVFHTGPNAGETVAVTINDMTSTGLAIDALDVVTNADAAITSIDAAILAVANERANLGAIQANRLETVAENMRNTLENTMAAEATIRDTDFAAETAEFTKNQILVQAGATVLQNANATSQLVLSLLRG